MGVLDKFLDIMKLSDDEDDYDDFYDDEDDYEYEEKPKKGFFNRNKSYDEEEEDTYDVAPRSKGSSRTSSKVTPMRQPARRSNVSMEVCVVKPTSVEDSREITETLLSGRTVILNLEGLDLEIAQRIIDFTSGATYAIDVDISGDLQDLLNTSFDASSMRSRF